MINRLLNYIFHTRIFKQQKLKLYELAYDQGKFDMQMEIAEFQDKKRRKNKR